MKGDYDVATLLKTKWFKVHFCFVWFFGYQYQNERNLTSSVLIMVIPMIGIQITFPNAMWWSDRWWEWKNRHRR